MAAVTNRERRTHVRKRVNLEATIQVTGGSVMVGNLRDMSLSGAFIVGVEAPAFGTVLSIQITIDGQSLTLAAIIRWAKPAGIGVQFGSLGARETYLITEMLASADEVPDSRRPETD